MLNFSKTHLNNPGKMSILHLNINAFAAQIEEILEPKLKGRPFAVISSSAHHAPLLSVSPLANQWGVQPGMKLRQVKKHYRQLRLVEPHPQIYARTQQSLIRTINQFTPYYESDHEGSAFLNMNGTRLLFGPTREAATKLRQEVFQKLSLKPALGIAKNKLVAAIASELASPHGLFDVLPGQEADFLKNLEIERLPDIDHIASPKLWRQLGIQTIGELASIPTVLLTKLFGKAGRELKEKALGIDHSIVKTPNQWYEPQSFLDSNFRLDQSGEIKPSPLVPRSGIQVPMILSKTIIEQPNNDDGKIKAIAWQLLESAAQELRLTQRMTSRLNLLGIYTDHRQTQLSIPLSEATQSEFTLFQKLETKWKKFLNRRVNLKYLQLQLTQLTPQFLQLHLNQTSRESNLLKTLDQIRQKYGAQSIRFVRK